MRWMSIVVPIAATLVACKGPDDPSASGSEEATTSTNNDEAVTETDTGTATETETGEDPSACPARTPAELMDCVDQARFEADLEFVSQERVPGSPHWQAMVWQTASKFAEDGASLRHKAAAFLHFYSNQLPPLARQEFLRWRRSKMAD